MVKLLSLSTFFKLNIFSSVYKKLNYNMQGVKNTFSILNIMFL